MRRAFLERAVVELVYKFDEKVLLSMFEKVSRSLKYDSNIFFVYKHIYIYMDTTVDHFTPLALRVRGKKYGNKG